MSRPPFRSPFRSPPSPLRSDTPLPGVRDAARRVGDLCTGELLVLAVLRLWAGFISAPRNATPQWQDGLSAAGVAPEGAAAFDTLFRIVVAAARRPLDIHRPSCPMLGTDEGRFFDMVCLAQHGLSDEASVLLADWVAPAAVRMALPPLCLYARSVAQAGLILPVRAAAQPPDLRISTPSDRGAALIH